MISAYRWCHIASKLTLETLLSTLILEQQQLELLPKGESTHGLVTHRNHAKSVNSKMLERVTGPCYSKWSIFSMQFRFMKYHTTVDATKTCVESRFSH